MNVLTVFHAPMAGRKSDDLLRSAASLFSGLPPSEFETVRVYGKKPFFRYHPELFASVSHSGGIWACALSFDGPVGLDIQLRKSMVRRDGIARRYFHPDEAAAIRASNDPDGEFIRIWCRKEAAVKQSGRGIDGLFRDFVTTRSAADDPEALFSLPDGALYFREFRLPDCPDCFCCTAAPFPHEIRLSRMETPKNEN